MGIPERRTLLIVDDVVEIVELLRQLAHRIAAPAFELIALTDPEEALALLGRRRIDVALVDYRMPRHTGVDVLREVRSRHPNARIVLMTGYNELPNEESAIEELKLDALLRKPLHASSVIALLGSLLRDEPR